MILLSAPDAWFAYPFPTDGAQGPDYARTVDIHRKPGYDLRAVPRQLAWAGAVISASPKKLGFRGLFDVIPDEDILATGLASRTRRTGPSPDRRRPCSRWPCP
ncbi:MAG: hypothetical protein U0800_19820 [Isosphaeraceae bacterium]